MKRTSDLLCLLMVFSFVQCTKMSVDSSKKVFNAALVSDVKGFDPALSVDQYTHIAVSQIYQGLMQYHYLKRPYELQPLLAESMPEVSKDGLTYTFKIRKGVYFHDDPAFGGKKRELKAWDVEYSFLRLADPHTKSANYWIFEDRIEGLDEFRTKVGKLNAPIDYSKHNASGIKAISDYEFQIKLKRPYRQLLYVLAMAPTMIVAKEIVEAYGKEFLNHPVGTGPFVFKEWKRGQKIVFEKNTHYWNELYPSEGEESDTANGLLEAKGKKLPLVDELILWIYVESQPAWLNFLRGNLDIAGIPKEAFDTVFNKDGNVKPEILEKKIVVQKHPELDIVYFTFNLLDPILGKNKNLRCAISSVINRKEKIDLFYNNRAIEAHSPIPPGIFGYDPTLRNPYDYNVERAKLLYQKALEEYEKETGKKKFPKFRYDDTNSTASRQLSESILHDLKALGLEMEVRTGTWPQFSERLAKSDFQMAGLAWHADYPDAENFLQLLYSKNVSPGPNHAHFKNAEFDRLYEKMRDLPDNEERATLIRRMIDIIHQECPWVLFNHRVGVPVFHAWLRNYKRSDISPGLYKYLDVELQKKSEVLKILR